MIFRELEKKALKTERAENQLQLQSLRVEKVTSTFSTFNIWPKQLSVSFSNWLLARKSFKCSVANLQLLLAVGELYHLPVVSAM